MKKVLSLAFIAAVLLLGCSADGFYDEQTGNISWGKVCLTASGCTPVGSRKACEAYQGKLVMLSECPSTNIITPIIPGF